MTNVRSTRYLTEGGITVYRASVNVDYCNGTEEIQAKLDTCQGALFTSGVEFPGRYTRWDVGFVNPPLKIHACGRRLVFTALNGRGVVLLKFFEDVVSGCEAVGQVEVSEQVITAELKPPHNIVFEEERSRQFTVFSLLRDVIALFRSGEDACLGLYGAFGYELAFQFEAIALQLERDPQAKDLVLYLPDEILVVDHQKESASRHSYDFESNGLMTRLMHRDGIEQKFELSTEAVPSGSCDHAPGEYAETVHKALKYFARGDLFETVPGQLFREKCVDSPADIFRRLKKHNPSPYGAFINLGDGEYLVAASPEMFVRVEQRETGMRVETCPISGTIARGSNAIEDADQIRTLLNSAKDEAELSMCTDVDRNDKSRICESGTVKVIGRKQIELYSRLIHTVDHVEGMLRPQFDALDAFLSHTWAVTVTGAPKHAAVQFIEAHEKSPRRWYGGSLGFLRFNGEINTGLTLRTIRIDKGVAEIRAGATLLFDSIPEDEEAETRLKASALVSAIRNDYPGAASGDVSEESTPCGMNKKVLMVDHQDSFVHTLAAYFRETGASVSTVRPDSVADVLSSLGPDLVVLSPGPGKPGDFGLNDTLSLCLNAGIPVFGVCLGLQGIVEYFGGELGTLDYPMHGKSSCIEKTQGSLFDGIPLPMTIGRYHSLVADVVPSCIKVTARTPDGVVMAIEHKTLPVSAVQFHPESILSLGNNCGTKIIRNVMHHVTMLNTHEKIA
ncbi:MAG: anthranilate synthase component I [Gammaproteobacteria bacterium]|nr:anthranilate synthase component I [Gammaproteobacteria bacterium]